MAPALLFLWYYVCYFVFWFKWERANGCWRGDLQSLKYWEKEDEERERKITSRQGTVHCVP